MRNTIAIIFCLALSFLLMSTNTANAVFKSKNTDKNQQYCPGKNQDAARKKIKQKGLALTFDDFTQSIWTKDTNNKNGALDRQLLQLYIQAGISDEIKNKHITKRTTAMSGKMGSMVVEKIMKIAEKKSGGKANVGSGKLIEVRPIEGSGYDKIRSIDRLLMLALVNSKRFNPFMTRAVALAALDCGANPNVLYADRQTPLHKIAAEHRDAKIMQALINNGAYVKYKKYTAGLDKKITTPLHEVMEGQCTESTITKNSGSPVSYWEVYPTIEQAKRKIIRLLLKNGANINHENEYGNNVYYSAQKKDDKCASILKQESKKIVRELKKAGASQKRISRVKIRY